MTMLNVSFAKSIYKGLTRRKTKKMHFYVPDFVTGTKLSSFRDHQQSKYHLAALTFEVTVPQCLDVIAIANLFAELKDNRKRMFRKFTEKDL